jgi:hypothetical protein
MGGAIFPLPLSHHELYKGVFPEKINLRIINLSLYATPKNIRGVEVHLHSFLASDLGECSATRPDRFGQQGENHVSIE